MARYLLAATPLRGHLAPMLVIGSGLQSLGHHVTVLTGASLTDSVRAAGLDVVALPDNVRIDPPAAAPMLLRNLPAPLRRFWLGRAELRSVFVEPLVAEAHALRGILDEGPVDAILADVTFTGALAILLSEAPRAPIVACGVAPLTLSSVDTPPFGMAWQPQQGVDYSRMTAAAHQVIMRDSQRAFEAALRRAGVDRVPVFISDWPRLADALVQLSVAGFEYPRCDLPDTVEFVGPALPSPDDAFEKPSWWSDLFAASTVVLVTQGTFDNTDLDQLITPTLRGLADLDDVLVVATTGGRAGQELPQHVPANARVTDWVPYSALMPHVDVMITNGGYGGVQYALSHGVPLVVAGETSDKAEVAARVTYTGVGVDLKTSTPTPQAVRAAVVQVRDDRRYRTAAQRLRAEIDCATPIDTIANTLKRCSDA
ncbi:glycosyltransferase [Mycobacterium sp. SMC-4]|uniref:glycosyltransferase n=1 Tax=Mycobacterium sp. SMC-4 TaxID=2857059 RepID=UPI003D05AA75